MGFHHGLCGAGDLAVEVDGWIVLARLGQHEGVHPLGAGELRQVTPRLIDGEAVVFRGVRVLLFQLAGVEIALLPRQLQTLGVHRAAVGPPLHEHGREEQPAALIVMGSRNQVCLEGIVGGAVIRAWRYRQTAQRLQNVVLGLPEEQLLEAVEVDAPRLRIEVVACVQAPAVAPGSAVALVLNQRFQGLPQRVQLAQALHRCQVRTAGFAR